VLKDRLHTLKADRDRAKAALERAKEYSVSHIRIDPALIERFGRTDGPKRGKRRPSRGARRRAARSSRRRSHPRTCPIPRRPDRISRESPYLVGPSSLTQPLRPAQLSERPKVERAAAVMP
jgi:hypothetical protein